VTGAPARARPPGLRRAAEDSAGAGRPARRGGRGGPLALRLTLAAAVDEPILHQQVDRPSSWMSVGAGARRFLEPLKGS
jgi:hypothetical protein